MRTSTKLLAKASRAILSLVLLAGINAPAATRTWDGGGADNNWATAANWNAAIAPGDDLVFPGGVGPGGVDATSLNNTNNSVPNTAFNSITISGTNYTLRGNAIILTNGISHTSIGANTLLLNIQLDAPQTFASTVAAGSLIVGGNISLNGQNLTNNTTGSIDLSGEISGAGNLIKSGTGTLRLLGTAGNVYAGSMTVNVGVLELGKSGLAIAGPLNIGDGIGPADSATVRLLGANQISDSAGVTMEADGLLDLNNQDDSLGALTFNGGDITTGNGTLFMGGNATINANTNSQALISGKLSVAVTRAFNGTGHYWSPDLSIMAAISGSGGLIKMGVGELGLAGSNSYSGLSTINAGLLQVMGSNALGTTASGTVVDSGATLILIGNTHVGGEALTLNGNGVSGFGALSSLFGSNSWAGNITLASSSRVTVRTNDFLNLTGVISGSSGLIKDSPGTLIFSGASANTYLGATTVNAGTLLLNKSPSVAGIPRALVIGDGSGGTNADVVRLQANQQISDSSAVTINSSGLLHGNGFIEVVGPLSGQGNLQLAGNSFSVLLVGGTVTFNGIISGPGNLVELGSGSWILNGANTFSGSCTINGTTFVNGALPASSISVFGTLGGTGTVGRVSAGGTGTISPGLSPGRLTSSNVTFAGSSTLRVELNGTTPGSGYDQLNVNGFVDLTNATLNATLGFLSLAGSSFTIIDNDGSEAITNTFPGLPEGATANVSGTPFSISYTGGSGNDVVLTQLAATQLPLLNIQRSGDTNVVLSWATNFTGFTLEASTNLSTNVWSVVSPAPAVSGTDNVLTNAAIESGKFYRLRAP